METTPKTVYLHLERMCGRRLLDIEKIRRYLEANSCQVVTDPSQADHVLFFGCAFNDHSERRSLEALRHILTDHDDVFVLGGIADTLPDKLAESCQIDRARIIGCRRFEQLDAFFSRHCRLADTDEVNQPYQQPSTIGDRNPAGTTGKGTYVVQVAHGCADQCSYCGDKLIVKDLRSKPLDQCVAEVRRGIDEGYTRIELLGDDVGAYGLDLGLTVADLLRKIVSLPGDFSLSLQEVNVKYLIRHLDELDAILSSRRLSWLVVAFQSGNDRILQLMNRGYTRSQLEELLSLLSKHGVRKRFHAIAGFPTESSEEFADTLSIIQGGRFVSGSLFRYEDRVYAPAYKMTPKVSEAEKDRRMAAASEALEQDFERQMLPDKLMVNRPNPRQHPQRPPPTDRQRPRQVVS